MSGIRHKIYVRHQGIEADKRLDITLIKRCVRETLRYEGADVPCEISVLITDNDAIHAMNLEYRGADKPTDVLSFPMQIMIPGDFQAEHAAADPETGLLPLGDIVLSAEQVAVQALEYGHTRERETAYLTVHSVLHLLGYDHMDEGAEKKNMRMREEYIMHRI